MILVTGATGFVGSHIFGTLRRRHEGFRALARDREKYRSLFGAHGRPVHANLHDLRKGDFNEDRVTAIVHCAAEVWPVEGGDARRFDSNIEGTRRLFDAVDHKHLEQVVLLSSFAVCGALSGTIDERTPRKPQNPYAESKAAQEELCEDFAARTGLPVAILRLPSVYGARQHPETVLPRFVEEARAGRPLILTGPPLRLQNFLYVADVVEAVDRCLDVGANGIFALGAARETTLRELADTIVKVTGSRAGVGVSKRDVASAPSAVPFHIDTAHARERLGWEPQFSLEQGLREMLAAQ